MVLAMMIRVLEFRVLGLGASEVLGFWDTWLQSGSRGVGIHGDYDQAIAAKPKQKLGPEL